MPEIHFEPYLFFADLSHRAALVAWGGFYFRVRGTAVLARRLRLWCVVGGCADVVGGRRR